MSNLGERIAGLRQNRKQSLQNVADIAGVSKAHIWEIERGKADNPSMNLVTRLADHFEVSVSWLIGEDPSATDADQKLAAMFREAKTLPEGDLEHIQALIRSMSKNAVKEANG